MPQIKKETNTNPTLRVLKIGEYRGFKYLVQEIVSIFMFQSVIYYRDQFYQVHNIITPEKDKEKLSDKEVLEVIGIMSAMAETTIEELERMTNPDYIPHKTALSVDKKVVN